VQSDAKLAWPISTVRLFKYYYRSVTGSRRRGRLNLNPDASDPGGSPLRLRSSTTLRSSHYKTLTMSGSISISSEKSPYRSKHYPQFHSLTSMFHGRRNKLATLNYCPEHFRHRVFGEDTLLLALFR